MKKDYWISFYSNNNSIRSVRISEKKFFLILSTITVFTLSVIFYFSFLYLQVFTFENEVDSKAYALNEKFQQISPLIQHMSNFAKRTADSIINETQKLPVESGIITLISNNLNDIPVYTSELPEEKINSEDMSADPEGYIRDLSNIINNLTTNYKAFTLYKEQKTAVPDGLPLKGMLVSGFGLRKSPFTGVMQFHRGIDIIAKYNTPIRSSGPGKVVFTGTKRLWGKNVLIDHGYGIKTQYGHLSEILVKAGQVIDKGDIIGKLGQTGRATGPHLHYQVWINEIPCNPIDIISNNEIAHLDKYFYKMNKLNVNIALGGDSKN